MIIAVLDNSKLSIFPVKYHHSWYGQVIIKTALNFSLYMAKLATAVASNISYSYTIYSRVNVGIQEGYYTLVTDTVPCIL